LAETNNNVGGQLYTRSMGVQYAGHTTTSMLAVV
jgi:hypothetical protein